MLESTVFRSGYFPPHPGNLHGLILAIGNQQAHSLRTSLHPTRSIDTRTYFEDDILNPNAFLFQIGRFDDAFHAHPGFLLSLDRPRVASTGSLRP